MQIMTVWLMCKQLRSLSLPFTSVLYPTIAFTLLFPCLPSLTFHCLLLPFLYFIHSFFLETYIAPLQTLLLRGAPSQVTAKKEGLQGDVKFGGARYHQGTQLKWDIIPMPISPQPNFTYLPLP